MTKEDDLRSVIALLRIVLRNTVRERDKALQKLETR